MLNLNCTKKRAVGRSVLHCFEGAFHVSRERKIKRSRIKQTLNGMFSQSIDAQYAVVLALLTTTIYIHEFNQDFILYLICFKKLAGFLAIKKLPYVREQKQAFGLVKAGRF